MTPTVQDQKILQPANLERDWMRALKVDERVGFWYNLYNFKNKYPENEHEPEYTLF